MVLTLFVVAAASFFRGYSGNLGSGPPAVVPSRETSEQTQRDSKRDANTVNLFSFISLVTCEEEIVIYSV